LADQLSTLELSVIRRYILSYAEKTDVCYAIFTNAHVIVDRLDEVIASSQAIDLAIEQGSFTDETPRGPLCTCTICGALGLEVTNG